MPASIGKRIGGFALAGAALTGGAGFAAWASSPAESPVEATSVAAPDLPADVPADLDARGRRGGPSAHLLHRAVHGTLEVKEGDQWITVVFDRGRVTDVAADHITLTRADGKTATLQLNETTEYRGVDDAAGVQKDRGALVVSNPDGTARLVVQPTRGERSGRHRPGRGRPEMDVPTTPPTTG